MAIVNNSGTIPVTGLEYTMVPDGTAAGGTYGGSQLPFSWSSVGIDAATSPPLNGYRIETRYKTVTLIPGDPLATPDPIPDTYVENYTNWHCISQTLTCTSHPPSTPGNPMETSVGDELFGNENEVLTGRSDPAVAGITDGKQYAYVKVFDQSDIDYIPPLSAFDSEPISGTIPTSPYDPDNYQFPVDTCTTFIPDEREFVTVTYQLTTVWNLVTDPNDPGYNTGTTSTVSFTQVVNQTTTDYTSLIRTILDRTYYGAGITPWKPDTRDEEYAVDGITQDGTAIIPDPD